MSPRAVWLVIAVLTASCGDTAPAGTATADGAVDVPGGPGPIALPDAGECPVVLLRSSRSSCIVEWSCREAGVLILACGPISGSSDGGTADGGSGAAGASDASDAGDADTGIAGFSCACGPEDQAPITVAGAPASCSEDDARQFVRQACGWIFP